MRIYQIIGTTEDAAGNYQEKAEDANLYHIANTIDLEPEEFEQLLYLAKNEEIDFGGVTIKRIS